jgi:hypothetical protein
MDYTQRIKNLDEQIKLYHTPKSKVTNTPQPFTINFTVNATVYEQAKLTYGYTIFPGTTLEVLNCIWCKQPPKHSYTDIVDNVPTTHCDCGTAVYCDSLSCTCEKEYILDLNNRVISKLLKGKIQLVFGAESLFCDDASKRGCVINWNNAMMSLLTGMVKPSYYDSTLSNGLFGNPFKC